MICLASPVLLSRLFAKPHSPPPQFWSQRFMSSKLLEYEAVNRVLARQGGNRLMPQTSNLLAQIELIDLTPDVLARALQPFPVQARTLDGLHLAPMDFLRGHSQTIEVATHDVRLAQAAAALGTRLWQL